MIYFLSLFLSITLLTYFQSKTLAAFLNPYFKANEFSLSLTTTTTMKRTNVEKELSLLIFTGLLNPSLLSCLFIYYPCLIPTALLICTENTFWDISSDGNFVESFKKSFMLYVKSGMREMMKTDIDILRNEQGELLVSKGSKAMFHKFIVEHYLRKLIISICTQHI